MLVSPNAALSIHLRKAGAVHQPPHNIGFTDLCGSGTQKANDNSHNAILVILIWTDFPILTTSWPL